MHRRARRLCVRANAGDTTPVAAKPSSQDDVQVRRLAFLIFDMTFSLLIVGRLADALV